MLLATNELGYVFASYGLTAVILSGFAALTIIRGRRLGRRLPPEDRRWL